MKLRFSLVVTALVFLSGTAAGEERHKASLWLDARPWTCSDLLAPLAHEIALACDAAGGTCRIAPSVAEADRKIVLSCKEEGRWVLEAETSSGERLWSVGLTGSEDDRLRRAALWVARVDSDEPLASPAPAPRPPPPAPAPAPPPGDVAPAAEPVKPPSEPGGGLAFSGHGAYETTADGSPLAGARAAFAARVSGGTRGVLALDAVAPTQMNVRPFSLFRAGLGASWGAPFSDDVLGASVEVGGALASSYRFGGTKGAPYAGASLTAQYPSATLRPFATAGLAVYFMKNSTGLVDSIGSLGPMVSLDLGLAWSAW